MANYNDYFEYIKCSDIGTEIDRIKSVIKMLNEQLENAIARINVEEYWLDSGQSRIKTVYRNPAQIESLIKIQKQKLIDIENSSCGIGRSFVLRDSRNFIINK